MLSISCPYCRSKTTLFSPTADSLPRNKVLEHLISEWHLSQTSISSLKCQLCKESPQASVSECLACELVCCQACGAEHLSRPRFSHHKLLSLAKTRRLVCIEHYLELEWFCTVEKVQVCHQCLERHQDHYVISKDQAKTSLRLEVDECTSQMTRILEALAYNNAKLSEELRNIEAEEARSLEELEAVCGQYAEDIRAFKAETSASIATVYAGIKTNTGQKLNNVVMLKQQLEQLLQDPDELNLLQKSFVFLKIKPYVETLMLPTLRYVGMQLPSLTLSSPSQNLYYLNRGTREFYTYNITSKDLLIRELPAESPTISRWSSFVTLSDGRILVTGGKVERNSGSHKTCMYIDPYKLQYSSATPMLRGHSSHISLRILNKVYIISGKNEDNVCDSYCEVFDVYTEVWTPISKINFPRTCASGAHIKEFIFVLGGFQNSVCNSIEKFNLNTNVWALLQVVLPEKIWQHGCFALDSKRILVFGGEKESEEPHKVSFIFDITNDSFSYMISIETIPVYLYFWIQVIREGEFLYSINKERTLVRYGIADNKWIQIDLA